MQLHFSQTWSRVETLTADFHANLIKLKTLFIFGFRFPIPISFSFQLKEAYVSR